MAKNDAVGILKLMLTSRAVEEREGILLRQGKSWMQIPCAGHEGTAALACQLNPTDYLFSYYRSCHLRLAKGIEVEQFAKDFFAKPDSSSGGRSVSVHCSSRALNVFPDSAVVASQCLPAAGVAWGQKLSSSTDITLCCIGDGATRQGEFYEAVCFAIQEKLPIIFLVEDNGYGISTSTELLSPFNLNIFDKQHIREVNGHDPTEVYQGGQRLIEKTRSGSGPTILWCHVDRLQPHTLMEDHRRYRDAEELTAMVDPITVHKKHLLDEGQITESEIAEIEDVIWQEVGATYERIEKEDACAFEPINRYLHVAPERSVEPVTLTDADPQPSNILDAFNQTLYKGLEKHPEIVLLGQDIEDPKGGVFGLTAGLSTTFPGRVVNAPLAEATILGTAIGLSLEGYKPICEIQFIDFITPAFSQINTHIGNLSWRSMGQWQCPLIMYAPYGAYLPSGGLWHSESNEAWWTHIPGLRVAIPSTPEDAAGLLASAMEESEPTFFLLPKHLLRVERQNCPYAPVPFGRANVVREGTDVTVVSWGNCVEIAEQAAMRLAKREDLPNNISVEVIDLRTLVPCDWGTVERSLCKTGRLVVIHEDNRTSSFGATVVTEMIGNAERFELLCAAPQLVARDNIPVPYRPNFEHEVLPSIADLIQAINVVRGKDLPPKPTIMLAMTEQILSAPQLGEGLTTVKIVALFKQAGEDIKKDEVIYAVETDKATVDIESPYVGRLIEWSVKVDEIINVGADVARIAVNAETAPEKSEVISDKCDEIQVPEAIDDQLPTSTLAGGSSPLGVREHSKQKKSQANEILANPVQSESLTSAAVDACVNGKSGDETMKAPPVEQADKPSSDLVFSSSDTYRIKSLSSQQRWLNTHFRRSREDVAPASLISFLSLTSLQAFNKNSLAGLPVDASSHYVSEFQLFAYLVSRVLVNFPKIKSVLFNEKEYREYEHINLGVAVQTERDELVTALVKEADTLDLSSFLAEFKQQVDRAVNGKDQASEHMPLVLSYMGGGNVLFGSPLLVAPAVATLFFSIPDDERSKRDGRAYLSFAFDHRLLNGMDASAFLNALSEKLSESIGGSHVSSNLPDQHQQEGSNLIYQLIAKHFRLDLSDLPMDKKLIDIGVDSISMTRLKFALEQNFDCDIAFGELASDIDLTGLVNGVMKSLGMRGIEKQEIEDQEKCDIISFQNQSEKQHISAESYLSSHDDLSSLSERELDEIYVHVKNSFSKSS